MVSLPKPEVILTHESDLDGFLSGLLLRRLARQLFDTDVPLQAYHNHSWRQRSFAEKSAWVCDLTFEPRLDKPDWVIVDHHTTEFSPKYAQLIHDVNKSAGLLCYELCKQHGISSPELDRLVHQIVSNLRRGQPVRLPGLGSFSPGEKWKFRFDTAVSGGGKRDR